MTLFSLEEEERRIFVLLGVSLCYLENHLDYLGFLRNSCNSMRPLSPWWPAVVTGLYLARRVYLCGRTEPQGIVECWASKRRQLTFCLRDLKPS